MSKKSNAIKKKRNKRYTGEDAKAPVKTNVTRIKATKKNPIQEFWIANKAKFIGFSIAFSVLFVVGYGIFALISWVI